MKESFVRFVPSPEKVILNMLELSNPKAGEILFDLGSGDARVLRIAAKKYGLKGVGIELEPKLVGTSRDKIREDGLEDYISIKEGSVMDFPLGDADIVTTYLNDYGMATIEDKILSELKPSARLVSHEYGFKKIKPNETHVTYNWEIPGLLPQPVFHLIKVYRMNDIKKKKSHFKQMFQYFDSK
jgi:predicted RNA methylase